VTEERSWQGRGGSFEVLLLEEEKVVSPEGGVVAVTAMGTAAVGVMEAELGVAVIEEGRKGLDGRIANDAVEGEGVAVEPMER
jgi:hypothetical protein